MPLIETVLARNAPALPIASVRARRGHRARPLREGRDPGSDGKQPAIVSEPAFSKSTAGDRIEVQGIHQIRAADCENIGQTSKWWRRHPRSGSRPATSSRRRPIALAGFLPIDRDHATTPLQLQMVSDRDDRMGFIDHKWTHKKARTNPSLAAPKFSGNRRFGQPFRYRRANRPRQLANFRWISIIFAQIHNDCAHRPAKPLHAGSRALLVRGHG